MPEPGSLERFIAAAREAVESEARENRDNRWWVLAPTLLAQRPDGGMGFLAVGPQLAGRPLGRALISGDPARILEATGAPRAAIALHVDLELGGDVVPGIVLAVLTRMVVSLQYARVERDDAGLPRLGPWELGVAEDELRAALRRAVAA